MKPTSCTVEKIYAFSKAPRCGAKSKRSGKPCKNPAVKDKSAVGFMEERQAQELIMET